MALIVEDGSGLANADSYISVADADTYHLNLGRESSWVDKDDEFKEFSLRRATNYMVQFYRLSWKGNRVLATQKLDWPRQGVVVDSFEIADDDLPVDIANACAELAFKTIGTTPSGVDLAPDLKPKKKRVKVGPIETEFFESATQSVVYRAIGGMLAPYIKSGAGNRLVRD